MKSTTQIITYMKQVQKEQMFGFENEVLMDYLSADEVKQFLKDGADLSDWKQLPLDRATTIKNMAEYMKDYGWDKALNHRGLSAGRTIDKMRAWAWLLGEDDLVEKMTKIDYPQYGAPILKVICEHMGFPMPDGEATLRMARGEPCEPGCESGCGQ